MTTQRVEPREFLESMTLAVRQAAAAVRFLEGRVKNRPKAGEDSEAKAALTSGDCVSQEVLLTALRNDFPWIELDAEEDTPTVRAFEGNRSAQRVIIDPIDGTLRYLNRDGLYAVLLGLEGVRGVEAVLVALPQEEVIIRAARGQGVEISIGAAPFEPAPLQARNGTARRILVSHELPSGLVERLTAKGFEACRAAGGAIGVAPLLPGTSAAIRTTQSHSGLSRRTWVSTLATLEAGGCVETLSGPLPGTFTPGIQEVIVARSCEEVSHFRDLLLSVSAARCRVVS